MYLLGYDIGSSSIKTALVDAKTKKIVKVVQYPKQEMEMISRQSGWAEQQPEIWWQNVCISTRELFKSTGVDPLQIKGVGISYQMHGLVVVDKDQQVIRPSIIWCDSRAVEIGNQAFEDIGEELCLSKLMNSPGNFTASKLKWIKDNEPDNYKKIHKAMLPGDYIAMKLTGEISTTMSGLSEGMFWDYEKGGISEDIMSHYGFEDHLIPKILPTFSNQGRVSIEASNATGLADGIPVTYRAGDQPNNALSLGVFEPGQVAATGGTSGVVYGVIDSKTYDPLSRVNNFLHVNHTHEMPRIGVLLCINGSGIQYSFIKQMIASENVDYPDMERIASSVPIGSDGLRIIPFGNGAERMLENKNVGAHFKNLQFNRHKKAHFYRASLEGIAFSFVYGIEIMRKMGLDVSSIKAGNDNLFQSKIFSETISNLTSSVVEIVETTGAVGAAKASGVGAKVYPNIKTACQSEKPITVYYPGNDKSEYIRAYEMWKSELNTLLK